MLDGIAAVQSRIQEIQARIASLQAKPLEPPKTPPNPKLSASLPITSSGLPTVNFVSPRPFDVALAEMTGRAHLRSTGASTGSLPPQLDALIQKYALQNGLQPEVVRAVIQQESSGNPNSVSVVGAQGLMQLMPETARGLGVQNAFDPEQNIAGGTKYLAGLLKEFGNDLPKALAAYNAGPGAVRKAGGVPHFQETQNYVNRIMSSLNKR